jgi:Domain of unknown function (DUF4265)
MADESDEQLTKVDVAVTDEVAREYGDFESLWARPVGDGEYELRSVPLWTEGLAWGDVVAAGGSSPNGRPIVDRVVRRGGHSTVMLAIDRDALGKPFDRAWKPLAKEGCTWDAWSETLRAVDVPPEANERKVAKALEWGDVTGIWTYTPLHVASAEGSGSLDRGS